MAQWNVYSLYCLSGELTQKLKKQKENLNIKDLAFLNETMQVEKSNVCFGMINEWSLCS